MRPAHPCAECGAPRPRGKTFWTKRAGVRKPVCFNCSTVNPRTSATRNTGTRVRFQLRPNSPLNSPHFQRIGRDARAL